MTNLITFGDFTSAPYTRLEEVIEEVETVDKPLLITEETTPPSAATPLSGAHPPNVAPPLPGPTLLSVVPPPSGVHKGVIKLEDGYVKITKNFLFLDVDVLRMFKEMTEAEIRIYTNLYLRTWGQINPNNICKCTNSEISANTGITSPTTFSKIMSKLEDRGLIECRYKARKVGEKSKYRVFLPCEVTGYNGTTIAINT